MGSITVRKHYVDDEGLGDDPAPGLLHTPSSVYTTMARNARRSGEADLADWFETVARSDKSLPNGRASLRAVPRTPISPEEVLPIDAYERLRPGLRPAMIAERARRRVALGTHVEVLFENRRTLWYQIHEVVRAQCLWQPRDILREVERYNDLLPAPGELSATVLLLDASARRARAELDLRLATGARTLTGRFDALGASSVRFVRFALPDFTLAAWLGALLAQRLALALEHQVIGAHAVLPRGVGEALAADLASSF